MRTVKRKHKVAPLPPCRHQGEEKYSSYPFLTSAPDGGEWSCWFPCRVLPPGKGPPVPIVQEARWAPEPVWTQRLEEKSFASARDRTPVVQSVVRHYTAWATPTPTIPITTAVNYQENFGGLVFPWQCCYCVVNKWLLLKRWSFYIT
jgi:hypothetical protein